MAEADPAPSHEPKNSKFKQQALPAWQPILTAGTVLPTFFVIGVAFIPIGVGLMYFSDTVKEVSIEYTDCKMDSDANKMCKDQIISSDGYDAAGKRIECQCTLRIKEEDIGEENWADNVFIYYGLTNFYQNHRRYVKSRDDKQLYGDLSSENQDCAPFLFKTVEGSDDLKYAPCGAIANSLFNDTIVLEYCEKKQCQDTDTWKTVKVTGRGIAWESDKQYKFKNPGGKNSVADIRKAWEDAGAIKPMDWQKEVWELDKTDPDNNGLQNEDLIVWMRTAALPNFRKLYRKVVYGSDDASFTQSEGLRADYSYRLKIGYNFEVSQFQGTKSVIISTTSILGGKNPFLGIAYIVVGCICFLMGIIFLFIHLKFGRTTQEMMNIDPRSQYNEN